MQSQLGPFIRSLRGSSLFKTAGSCLRNTTVTHRGAICNDQKNRQLFSERNTTKCNNFMNITARSSHLNNSKHIKITQKSFQIGDIIFRQYSTQNTEITKDEEIPPTITPDPAEPPPKERKIPKSLLGKYLELAKFRLASLVIVTTVGGYFMAPDPIDWGVMTAAAVGTTLAIASANSINQYIEVDNDLKMRRTANRMLPSGAMSLNHALGFGVVTGILGSVLLAAQVNVLAAGLAFSNILLYTLVYTPLKRVTPLNTWIGSVVGAIPPMIGWVANTGALDPGAWALFAVLFLWQMPHFFALSWSLRTDYARAGYRMLSVTHPHKVSELTLRYSYYLLPMGALCAATGVTTWTFALDSLLPALYMIYYAHLFHRDYKQTFKYKEQKQQERQERFSHENRGSHSEEHGAKSEGQSGSTSGAGSSSTGGRTGFKGTIGQSNVWARKTFFASLFYIPALLLLMILHKEERRTDLAIKKLKSDAEEDNNNSELIPTAK